MSFTEDMDAYFGASEVESGHAQAATYTPAGGTASIIYGIFDADYYEAADVESSKPAFHCAAADVSGVAQGDALVVNSATYEIVNVQPDGTGLVVLILEEQ